MVKRSCSGVARLGPDLHEGFLVIELVSWVGEFMEQMADVLVAHLVLTHCQNAYGALEGG